MSDPRAGLQLPGQERELRSDSDGVFRVISTADPRRRWVAGTRQTVFSLDGQGGFASRPLQADELLVEARPIFALAERPRPEASEYWVGGVRGWLWRRTDTSEDWSAGWDAVHDRLVYPPRFSLCADRLDEETGRLFFEVEPIRHIALTDDYAFLAYGVCPAAVIVRLAEDNDDLCVSMAFVPGGLNERMGYDAVAADAGRLALAGPTGIYVGTFSEP